MRKISKIFLLLLLLDGISSIQPEFNEDQNDAIPIEIGSSVEYDQTRNYFKFNYEGSTTAQIIFRIEDYDEDLYLTYPSRERINLRDSKYYRNNYAGNLTENGDYYLEVKCFSYRCELGGNFGTILFGTPMKTIDLSQNTYFNDLDFEFDRDKYYDLIEYKVSGLTEDKYVYFTTLDNDDYYYTDYYPYYTENSPYDPDKQLEPVYHPNLTADKQLEPVYHPNLTVFEVLNTETGESYPFVKFFKFDAGKEYIIKIHSLVDYYEYNHKDEYGIHEYIYLAYLFFPITLENYQVINSENEFFEINGPILVTIHRFNAHT